MRMAFMALWGLVGIVQIMVTCALVIFVIIKAIQVTKKHNLFKVKGFVVSLMCIAVAIASLIFNIGWYRFSMMLVLIPVIQPIVFLLTNITASKYANEARYLKPINIVFIVTYLLFWIFMPDGGDAGTEYLFFGLVHSDELAEVGYLVAFVSGLGHIACFVVQIIQFAKIKKRNKQMGM